MIKTWLIRTNDFKEVAFQGEVLTSNKSERLNLATKKLALYWCIALFCILIPVLHFILVPVFTFVGLFLFLKTLKLQFKLSKLQFTCPACQAQNLHKTLRLDDSLKFNCEQCQAQLVLISK